MMHQLILNRVVPSFANLVRRKSFFIVVNVFVSHLMQWEVCPYCLRGFAYLICCIYLLRVNLSLRNLLLWFCVCVSHLGRVHYYRIYWGPSYYSCSQAFISFAISCTVQHDVYTFFSVYRYIYILHLCSSDASQARYCLHYRNYTCVFDSVNWFTRTRVYSIYLFLFFVVSCPCTASCSAFCSILGHRWCHYSSSSFVLFGVIRFLSYPASQPICPDASSLFNLYQPSGLTRTVFIDTPGLLL